MKLFSRSSLFPKLIAMSLVVLLIAACAGPDSGIQLDPVDPQSDSANGTAFSLPKYYGFVDDPNGLPVAYAIVGGSEFTSEDGIASGDFPEYEGQWIPVEALGYATGYAKSLSSWNGVNIFITRLTSFQWVYTLDEGEAIQMFGSFGEEFNLKADISADLFQDGSVTVGLGAIDRLDVGQRLVLFHPGEILRLQYAFAIQAFNASWGDVQLADGKNIPVEFEFSSPLTDGAVFAVFDPVQGEWVEEDPACTTSGELVYSCQLPSTNPLWAIFDRPAADYSASLSIPRVGAPALTPINSRSQVSPDQQGTGTADDNFQLAWDKLADWLNNNPDKSLDDPAVKKMVRDIADIALEFAKTNRNEAGKKMLMHAGEAALFMGQSEIGEELYKETGKISDEIGKKALKEQDCGNRIKVENAIQQLLFGNGSQSLIEQLTEKATQMGEDCDIWVGTITLDLYPTNNHPAELPMSGRGGAPWREVHTVKIWTNTGKENLYEMHAKDSIQQFFPPISYVEYDPCRSEIIMFGTPGTAEIYYEGRYDGIKFEMGAPDIQGDGGFLFQTWDFNSLDEDDNCASDMYHITDWSPFYSLTVHDLASEIPPITLQEMLDDGDKTVDPNYGEMITGNKEISNPDPELGIYPYHKGMARWTFYHFQKRLPLPVE